MVEIEFVVTRRYFCYCYLRPTSLIDLLTTFARLSRHGDGLQKHLAMVVVLLALPIVFFYPAVFGDLTLAPGDGWTANLGLKSLVGKMIAEGHLPLWNPYIFAGMPFLASVYPGVLYPPNWLFALLPLGMAMNAVVITTFHLALIGAYLYARKIGCNRTGSLVAGVAFAFGGFLVAHLGQTSHIEGSVWMPWTVLAIEGISSTRQWRWVVLGAVAIAMQIFAGVPQACLYIAMVSGAYGLFCLVARTETRAAFLFRASAMAVCGVLLAGAQLIPLRELLPLSARAGIGYEFFSVGSLPPVHTLTLVFPYFFGGSNWWPYRAGYWGAPGTTELCGYVGLATLMLGAIALIGSRRNRLVWFWAGVAFVSLLLAYGSYLPFGLHRLLHQVPVYNLFRVSARNMLSVNFALAVLAGLGLSALGGMDAAARRRLWRWGAAVLAAMIATTTLLYLFFADRLLQTKPPAELITLSNTVVLLPLTLFTLTLAATWWYARNTGTGASAALVTVLLLDMASFGHFIEWRVFEWRLADHLPDPPTVRLVKARESDLNSFRVLSHAPWPYGYYYQLLNHPDFSILRGLQSVNGYDMLQLNRLSRLAGEMTPEGVVTNAAALDLSDQSFNLLNVKYVFWELPRVAPEKQTVLYEGLRFSVTPINAKLSKGVKVEIPLGRISASDFFCISNLGNSVHVPDRTPVARISLYTHDGRVIERELQAGRDVSEWAFDRSEVQAAIRHRRARVIESWPEQGFQGHFYLSRFSFDRTELARIELQYLLPDAELLLARASLLDGPTGLFVPLDSAAPNPDRWRKIGEVEQVAMYENLLARPRAWFVRRAALEWRDDLLTVIREGKFKDGSRFDPAETVLLEREDYGARHIVSPEIGVSANAEAKVTRYEPNRIELQTRNDAPGFLVLSEIWYRGWEALIDGRRAPVERVNYALRGLNVPAGEHRIEFVFRAHSFRNGITYSMCGVLLLSGGGIVSAARRRRLSRLAENSARFIISPL
jgi:hypothetical protein